MNARTGLWAQWAFFAFLTFLPVVLAFGMLVLGLGFVRWVWIISLLFAFVSFCKAQQTIASMRGLEEDPKLDKWLREARRRSASAGPQQPDTGYQIATPLPKVVKTAAKQFRRASFWRRQDPRSMQRHVYDLFRLLDCSVKNVAPHGILGPGLLVSNTTYVGFATNGKKSTHTDAKSLDAVIASSPSWRSALLISPQGFTRSSRAFANSSAMIVLDAENLARLSRRELSK